ncbi:MAG: hypothetical protein D6784_15825, partial [Chloroflexi bacterium]
SDSIPVNCARFTVLTSSGASACSKARASQAAPPPPPPDPNGKILLDTTQPIRFKWRWEGQLADDLSFEVRVWRQGDTPVGAHDARLLKTNPDFRRLADSVYAVDLVLAGAQGVFLSGSDYVWSVGVVRIEPEYDWLGVESAPRPIGLLVP